MEWEPGTLRAVGYDKEGKELCKAEKQTAGDAVTVRLITHMASDGLKADGADVALIEVEVADAQGRRCPTNLNMIHFELTGPAEWRGGIAQGPDNYILSKSLPVECGVNRVLVRSTPEAGGIAVTARADGLKPATVELVSRAVPVTNGLSTWLPAENLPSNLERGPTPSTPSFEVTRIAVPIACATAGANAGEVGATFDDNEETSWRNDGRLVTGWIEYELSREATLDEVVMKLRDWRRRSYPLRVSVDGEEVYRGETPRSLGYVTLPLKPVTGRRLKIQLISDTAAEDAFNITELAQQNNLPAADSDEPGQLGIVEIECYERVRN